MKNRNSSAVESGRPEPARWRWRAGHSVVVCVVAILVLLFSVQRVFVMRPSGSETAPRQHEEINSPPTSWLRDTRIEETEEYYLVKMSIPEIDENELEVVLDSGVLKVTGIRGVSRVKQGDHWIRSSEMRSSFQKTCAFPGKVEEEIVETRIEDGVLLVKVPRVRSNSS